MIAFLQFPIADIRLFSPEDPGRLSRPGWPDPIPFTEFVRGTGQVSPRTRGGIRGWVGESMLCDARNAIRLGRYELPEAGGSLGSVRSLLYADGFALVKFDVVVASTPRHLRSEHDPILVVDSLARATAQVGRGDGAERTELARAGPHLARHFLRATTRHAAGFAHESLCQPGIPCMLLAYGRDDGWSTPRRARPIEALDDAIGSVYHMWHNAPGGPVRVWIVRQPEEGYEWTSRMRPLRILLMRLHAEFEVFRAVMGAFEPDDEDLPENSADLLERYVSRAIKRIWERTGKIKKRLGEHEPFLSLAFDYYSDAEPGRIDGMIERSEQLRFHRQTTEKLERFLGEVKIGAVFMGDVHGNVSIGGEPIEDVRDAIPAIDNIVVGIRPEALGADAARDAVRAVWTAVDRTRAHLAGIKDEEIEPSPELAGLWSEAALGLAVFNPQLAEQLRMKAELWSDPSTWDDARVAEVGIGIGTIANKARALLQLVVPSPSADATDAGPIDCFVSHAREDKTAVVEPLVAALQALGVSTWYDDQELSAGEPLRRRIDQGLARARYGAVVLSPYFMSKRWPMNELYAIMALEDADGRKRLIPIRHGLTPSQVTLDAPLIGDRLSLSTESGIEALAAEVRELVVV